MLAEEQEQASAASTLTMSKLLEGGDVNEALERLEQAALEEIAEENYIGALNYLKKKEELLEALTTEGLSADRDQVLSTLTCTACCYQRMGVLDKCAAYLEACTIYTVPMSQPLLKLRSITDMLKRAKLQCLMHIQLCAILSQLGDHTAALAKAKTAVRLAQFAIESTARALKMHWTMYALAKDHHDISESLQQTHLLALRATPMVKTLLEFLHSTEPISTQARVMRSVLGVKVYPDWTSQIAISDMMTVQPLSTADLQQHTSVRLEFSKDFMLYKVANLSASYFCISTELLFLRGKQAFNPARDKPTEQFHMRAMRLLETYFPPDCLLLQHIAQTYEKRFITDLQEIPEEAPRPPRARSAKPKNNKLPGIGGSRSPTPTKPRKQHRPGSKSQLPVTKQQRSKPDLSARPYRRPGRKYRLSAGEEGTENRRNKSVEFLPPDDSLDMAYESFEDASPSPFIVN